MHKFAPEVTAPDFIRMMIMVEGENQGILPSLLEEPAEAFDAKPKKRKT